MLKPAIQYKDEIRKKMGALYYSNQMFFYTGCRESGLINIKEDDAEGLYQWASVGKDDSVVGYISYRVEFFESQAYNFGLFSFREGDLTLAYDLKEVLRILFDELKLHRIEWRAISGNHACRAYDRFLEKYGGKKHVMTDCARDMAGKYHDSYIYEIIRDSDDKETVKALTITTKRMQLKHGTGGQ